MSSIAFFILHFQVQRSALEISIAPRLSLPARYPSNSWENEEQDVISHILVWQPDYQAYEARSTRAASDQTVAANIETYE